MLKGASFLLPFGSEICYDRKRNKEWVWFMEEINLWNF